ncbi:RNA dependent RNA polymerase-domain-containing protein [Scenedesmus sp. NREL 46B-D3]|nr:RNA dependent RNA polymerase-domain-containing protein [Scenedesmus sp. NREL 46B-D3]
MGKCSTAPLDLLDLLVEFAEELLLKKQVWVTCLRSTATEAEITTEFSKYGSVQQLQLQRSNINGLSTFVNAISSVTTNLGLFALHGANGSDFSGSTGQQKPPPLPRAVVEFTDAAGAAAALAARQQIDIFSGRNGVRSSKRQLVLPAAGIDHLKQPCRCRMYRTPCMCPGYVKVVPHRPPRHQSYHRGGAGQHKLSAMQLQLGCPGPDGCTTITELDMRTMCSMTIDLQQRCVTIEAPFGTADGPQQHMLVVMFRDLRGSLMIHRDDNSITFTMRQPPKVLRKVPEDPTAIMWGRDGPEWELAMDPTAAAAAAACAGAGGAGDAAVGGGLAGAHGLLGRSTRCRVRLAAAAMDADHERFNVLRVHVTATRIKYLRPEPESGNRVIRHFSSQKAGTCDSHFLRVSFGDEHGDRLFDSRQEPVDEFYTLMSSVLQQGESGSRTALAAALRYWMGDAMDTEKVPAKCAARLGQCFSATVDGAEVQQHQSLRLADVERNGYCFSDGVGVISPLLLEEVLAVLPFAPRGPAAAPISAIQIRYGGAKGVLARCSTLAGRQLQLRGSQLKFGSSHPQLEVCSVAAWLPAYLNRQIIIMMSHNGVPNQAFLCKLESCLDDLAALCNSPQDALCVLPHLGGIEPGAQGAMLSMLAVADACQLPLDPLLNSCLRAVARWQVTDLRAKARLLVQQGATLMGVMDEFGVLEEGQVQSRMITQPVVVIGPVVLAKSPVSHMGDVRRGEAVAPAGTAGQQLAANYVNVMVFSQKGQRPLPNMLSGSDLDGDQYLVLWDHQLLQPANSLAQDYTAEKPAKVDQVTAEHLQQHFVNFVKNDNLGPISTWLLAQADALGPASLPCQQLAALHSTAVDFPKTGKPAELDFNLVRSAVHVKQTREQNTSSSGARHALQWELLTGCLRRLQRRQGQHHQSSEQRDQLQREQSPREQQELSTHCSEEFFDTRSIFSEASLLERQLSDQMLAAAQQTLVPTPLPEVQLPQTGPWVPDTPLLFAEPGLRFIPVPAVTGFAGFWEVIPERTTPHPQPIDVMLGASFLVKKVHKSLPGLDLKEVNGQLLLAAQPKFLPPGLPAAYTEVFEKNKAEGGSWNMRRDMRLGSTVGKIYMTDSGTLILRSETKPAFGRKVDLILEDYLTLEEGGQVIVDRMCCLEVATGRRVTQYQVARLRPDKA